MLRNYTSNNVTKFPGHFHDYPASEEDELSENGDKEPSHYSGNKSPNSAIMREEDQLSDHKHMQDYTNGSITAIQKMVQDMHTFLWLSLNQYMIQKILGHIKVYYLQIILGKKM